MSITSYLHKNINSVLLVFTSQKFLLKAILAVSTKSQKNGITDKNSIGLMQKWTGMSLATFHSFCAYHKALHSKVASLVPSLL